MPTLYRVTRITTTSFGEQPIISENEVFIGTDMIAFSTEYPPSDIMGADPLELSQLENGCITMTTRYEQLEDGHWQECDDPRVRVTPVTELEREIDAENRRLFPADFSASCDICGYPDCDGDCQDPDNYCDNCSRSLSGRPNMHGPSLCKECLKLKACHDCGDLCEPNQLTDGYCSDCVFDARCDEPV